MEGAEGVERSRKKFAEGIYLYLYMYIYLCTLIHIYYFIRKTVWLCHLFYFFFFFIFYIHFLSFSLNSFVSLFRFHNSKRAISSYIHIYMYELVPSSISTSVMRPQFENGVHPWISVKEPLSHTTSTKNRILQSSIRPFVLDPLFTYANIESDQCR